MQSKKIMCCDECQGNGFVIVEKYSSNPDEAYPVYSEERICGECHGDPLTEFVVCDCCGEELRPQDGFVRCLDCICDYGEDPEL